MKGQMKNFKMQVSNLKPQCTVEQWNGYCQHPEAVNMKENPRYSPKTQRIKTKNNNKNRSNERTVQRHDLGNSK